MDTEEGVEVVWNEVRYSHNRKTLKGSKVRILKGYIHQIKCGLREMYKLFILMNMCIRLSNKKNLKWCQLLFIWPKCTNYSTAQPQAQKYTQQYLNALVNAVAHTGTAHKALTHSS